MRLGQKFGVRCGVAKRNTAWRSEFGNETAQHSKIQRHSKASKAKMGLCLGGGHLSLSLSLVSFLFAIYFFNFLNLFARLVILSVATQRVARRKPQQKNPHKSKENLPFLDTSLTLSMTNLCCRLKLIVCHTHILGQKFKFFTQNSRYFINSNHFINPTHFITLSQISSHTQGFFIFLPQVFAQFLLINSTRRSSYGRQDTKAPF